MFSGKATAATTKTNFGKTWQAKKIKSSTACARYASFINCNHGGIRNRGRSPACREVRAFEWSREKHTWYRNSHDLASY